MSQTKQPPAPEKGVGPAPAIPDDSCLAESFAIVCNACGSVLDDSLGWPDSPCSTCGGDGELSFDRCLGDCDQNGNHPKAEDRP